jgi:hypothetical protein
MGNEWTNAQAFKILLENCALLDYYARLLTIEDGTDRMSRNVGKELPLYAA